MFSVFVSVCSFVLLSIDACVFFLSPFALFLAVRWHDLFLLIEPHSKRLKVLVTIRKEVLNKVMLQQDTVVEVREKNNNNNKIGPWGLITRLV